MSNKENNDEFSNWHSRRKWRHITSHGTRYNFVIHKRVKNDDQASQLIMNMVIWPLALLR